MLIPPPTSPSPKRDSCGILATDTEANGDCNHIQEGYVSVF
jgi:hypothetical protein